MNLNRIRYSLEEAKLALNYIDAHSRETWLMAAMALKSEFGEAGRDIWFEWSQTASNFELHACVSTWKSIRAEGGITIASLIAEAKQHGYTPQLTAKISHSALVEIRAANQKADEEHKNQKAQQRHKSQEIARQQWEKANDINLPHPYVTLKNITPYGAKQLGSEIVVPLYIDDQLINLQTITGNGTKRFNKGAQLKEAYLILGKIREGCVVCFCEGWATACSLHQATGWTVVVVFSAFNLVPVIQRLGTTILAKNGLFICADNDENRAGQKAAEKAATCFPSRSHVLIASFSDEQIEIFKSMWGKRPSDFNDLALLEGTQFVKKLLHKEIQTMMPDFANLPKDEKSNGNSGNNGNKFSESLLGKDCSESEVFPFPEKWHGNERELADGFMLELDGTRPGVYWIGTQDCAIAKKLWLCGVIWVKARTCDEHGHNWGWLLVWHDQHQRQHTANVSSEMVFGETSELASMLASRGLMVAPSRKTKECLKSYIAESPCKKIILSVAKVGWQELAFVMPSKVICAKGDKEAYLQGNALEHFGIGDSGELSDWQNQVANLAINNDLLMFAICTAFAAPLTELINESGGFHIVGASSTGKSTVLEMAASVMGPPKRYILTWKATSNGIEGICVKRNNLILILDELGQIAPSVAGDAVYLIANGQGKVRANRSGAARQTEKWNTLILSAGEIDLQQHMQEAGKKAMAGQELRLVSLDADAGAGMGIFQDLHGYPTGAELSVTIKAACSKYFGTAGPAFIQQIVNHLKTLPQQLSDHCLQLIKQWGVAGASGQVQRVARRFALVGLAGELAIGYGIVPWKEGDAIECAHRLFQRWLLVRGSLKDREIELGIEALRHYLEVYGESRFSNLTNADNPIRVSQRSGFKGIERNQVNYYILPGVLRNEIFKGLNADRIIRELRELGILKSQSADRHTHKIRVPSEGNATINVYWICDAIWRDCNEN